MEEENISPVIAQKTQFEPTGEAVGSDEGTSEEALQELNDKMAKIEFENISGYYTRRAVEEDGEYIEMFSFEKNTFIRISTKGLDREVFAYNYKSDDFTYIYYFDGVMTAKTVMNVGTGAVLEDPEGYAEILSPSADELKDYFKDLMEAAGLVPDELH